MLNFKKIFSSGIHAIKETFSFSKTQKETQRKVDQIISSDTQAANDDVFEEITSNTRQTMKQSTNDIVNQNKSINNKGLSDFSGTKILTIKNRRFKLIFENGEIKKALKEVHGKYIHVNAKTIRQLTTILQANSNNINKVSYSTKRNTANNITNIPENKIKLNGSKKHNEAILARQKREKNRAEKIKQNQDRIEKESHMKEDYKILYRYQTALSKCNTQGEIVNGSEKIAEVILKTLAARKGINLHNFDNFLSSKNKFEVFKKVINEYLTIDSSYSTTGQSNRDGLFNIFVSASEIYNKFLYKKNKYSNNKEKKSGPNIYDQESTNHKHDQTDDLSKQKSDWVNKYYPNEEAA